jgi:hypothetical protein
VSLERGEYRSIRRVLLDGPDFQKLPAMARWVFVALKLNIGPTGIDVMYPAAAVIELAAQTGLAENEVVSALVTLEQEGWIKRELNVLWVVGHLENDPHMSAKDEKHRKSVSKHLGGLPRLDIVRAFVRANRDFFPPSDAPSESLKWAIEGPAKGHRSREKERERDKEKESSAAASPGDSWTSRLAAVWSGAVGPVQPGHIGKRLKPLVDQHGEERVTRAVKAYIAVRKGDGKTCKLEWFASEAQIWIGRTAEPPAVVDGEMNQTMRLLTTPEVAA